MNTKEFSAKFNETAAEMCKAIKDENCSVLVVSAYMQYTYCKGLVAGVTASKEQLEAVEQAITFYEAQTKEQLQ